MDEQQPGVAARRRRLIRIAAIAAGVLVVLLAGAALLLPRLVDPDRFRPRIQAMARERLGREVSLGEMDLSVFPVPAVTVASVQVAGRDGQPPMLEAGRVRIGAALLPLLSRRLEITRVTLERPVLRVHRDASGRWDYQDLLAPEGGEGGGERTVSLDSLGIEDGSLHVSDAFVSPGRVLEHSLVGLDVDVSGLSRPTGPRRLRVEARVPTAGDGTFAFDGEIGPGSAVDGRMRADGVDLGPAAPYLESLLGMAGVRGVVSGDVRMDRRPEGATKAEGSLSVSGLVLPIAAAGAQPLDATGRFDVDVQPGGVIDVDLLELDSGETSLKLEASARPDGPNQVVELSLQPTRVRPQDLARLAAAVGASVPEGLDAREKDGSVGIGGRVRIVRAPADGEGARRMRDVALDGVRLADAALVVHRGPAGFGLGPVPAKAAPRKSTPQRAQAGGAGPDLVVRDLVLENVSLTLVDTGKPGSPRTRIDDVDLKVASWAPGQEGRIELTAKVASGTLRLEGTVGPVGEDATPVALDVKLEGAELDGVESLLGMDLPAQGGRVDLTTRAEGTWPSALGLAGRLDVKGATVPRQGRDPIRLDLPVTHDVTLERGGQRIAIRSLELGLPGTTLALQGHVDRSGPTPTFELATREPVRLADADIDRLMGFVGRGPAGLDLEAQDPVELSVRIVRDASGTKASGRATLRRLVVRHAALAEPLRLASADVELTGDKARLSDLKLQLGASDLAGSATVEDFDAPRIGFALSSQRADLDELFGAFRQARERGGGPARQGPGLLEKMRARGSLDVADATFGGLRFTNFEADVSLAEGVLSIEPASLDLYGGHGSRAASVSLGGAVPSFTVDADLRGVSVGQLLAEGLGYDQFTGTGQATMNLRGSGGSLEQALRSATGGGSVTLREGRIGGLDMLKALERAGVFGERSLASLAARLAAEGTTYESLTGRYDLREGRMLLQDVELKSPDALISASGPVDLIGRTLDLDAQVLFTQELSQRMRDEGSRAAELFWDPAQGRVLLPLKLSGPIGAPKAVIDWDEAASRLLKRKATEELSDRLDERTGGLLGQLLGGGTQREPERPAVTAPQPPAEVERRGRPPAPGAQPQTSAPSAPAPVRGGLSAEVASARFGGNFLAPDLRIEARLGGEGISHAVVVVKGADGRELAREEQALRQAVEAAGGGAASGVTGRVTIDGKTLLGNQSVVIEVTPVSRDGRLGTPATMTVERGSLF